jgi:hypothetical protein
MFQRTLSSLGSVVGWRKNRSDSSPDLEAKRTRSPLVASGVQNPKESREERIRLRAYLLAEAAGFPEGRADEFWLQAEKENLNLVAQAAN